MRLAFALLLFVVSLSVASAKVIVVSVEGEINEGTYITLRDALAAASRGDTLLVELDTPGGLLVSTQKIVELFLNSPVPVVVYVPKGAMCASAGTIILLASDVAAMANGTSIGAATPISAYGGEVERKVVNYFASYVRSIAEEKGRNPEIAEKFVSEALSLTAREAYEEGIVDLLADGRTELLQKIDGRVVKGVEIDTSEVVQFEEPLQAVIMKYVTNPLIASLLLLAGIYLLIFGLTSPGLLAETLGAICLLLALAGLGIIQEVNVLGIALIVLGVILLIAELLTPTYGVLGAASLACTVLGLILLVKDPLLPESFYSTFRMFAAGVGVAFGGIMTFAVVKVAQTRKRKSTVGEVVGEVGEVMEFSGGKGLVKVRGEIWRFESDEEFKPGDRVEIVAREGLTLRVRKLERRRGTEDRNSEVA
ncbi:MAG: nodulation protein NfeD [Archaeoglobaceae archaeon]